MLQIYIIYGKYRQSGNGVQVEHIMCSTCTPFPRFRARIFSHGNEETGCKWNTSSRPFWGLLFGPNPFDSSILTAQKRVFPTIDETRKRSASGTHFWNQKCVPLALRFPISCVPLALRFPTLCTLRTYLYMYMYRWEKLPPVDFQTPTCSTKTPTKEFKWENFFICLKPFHT